MAMDEAANQEEMLGGCGAWARHLAKAHPHSLGKRLT